MRAKIRSGNVTYDQCGYESAVWTTNTTTPPTVSDLWAAADMKILRAITIVEEVAARSKVRI